MTDESHAGRSKFDLGNEPGPTVEAGQLPWSYGENRITAIVRDPDSAYLYWEISDEAIAHARERLGPAGRSGWCNLRVYDTTGRDFDGTNANDYFDIQVDRNDREYFLMIRRPTSTIHVDVGIKSHEGYFQSVARSGRAEFPRNDPSPNTSLEWMTVSSDGAPPAAAPCRSRYSGPEPSLPSRAAGGYDDVWRAGSDPSAPERADSAPRDHPPHRGTSPPGRVAHIEPGWPVDEWRAEWRGGLRFTRVSLSGEQPSGAWLEGPFPVESFDPERVAVELFGEPPAQLRADGTEFTVYGPWRVVIRNFEEPHRRVLATWSMRWVRAMTPMTEQWGQRVERELVGQEGREQITLGASERHGLLERGASERWRLGGSERLWVGASEWFAWGASETRFAGASQLGWAWASAALQRGASERIGASERWRAGASRIGGASELPIAADERWGGRL